jgi:hypothetical protein
MAVHRAAAERPPPSPFAPIKESHTSPIPPATICPTQLCLPVLLSAMHQMSFAATIQHHRWPHSSTVPSVEALGEVLHHILPLGPTRGKLSLTRVAVRPDSGEPRPALPPVVHHGICNTKTI